ncbi:Ubiquitin carboxyl-terminal hydrolase 8 [Colletotrichum sidae]|uniref:Ubiquitin carboxyl-terminal hydrolase 8 n=3 Tax=Colletotrichum orbiculare species complex TaxID=2707354 RepID=A0A4R8R8I6_COLTR|nr:Ubiquitin carboxyl-terminal hydrolase 8 [Colletotrichum spinosum]TDZ51560.1 Ubiquitin carboxyl-terminal hydrolase 8 [Colletotrichum trifolii]TEA12318.1 Ubiquitin carboxyl-terminal hydrolase 8 [Colletotrichum sidae]
MAARPSTPMSPKPAKVKSPVPGTPVFGCEHIQRLLTQSPEVMNQSIHHYKMILRNIFELTPVISQTTKTPDGQAMTSLTSNYLCLQCSSIVTEDERLKHGTKKQHRFYVDSRSGSLYCRKRKHDEMFSDSLKDNPLYISTNTTIASCKASGLRGIYNAGATCYQNVVLQSFLHNPLLRNFYLSDGHQSNDCNHSNCLSCAMDDMFQDFYAAENTNGFTAASILSGFWISDKKAFENLVTTKEQDAHEFFQFLAEELHERNGDGKRPETGSEHTCNCIIHQTFYGKLQSSTTCQNCGGVTNAVQSFLDLSLGLDSLAHKKKKGGQKTPALTLQECLDEEYVKSDKCEYRCNSCNSMQQARRNTSIKRLPNVLAIQFKRFEYKQGRHDRAPSKIDTVVNFPLQLNMLPYTTRGRGTEAKDSFELGRSCTYDLLGVVVHVGELDTGHYVSYCRMGDQWFKFNDHKVELAANSDVLSAQPYLLFYIIRALS